MGLGTAGLALGLDPGKPRVELGHPVSHPVPDLRLLAEAEAEAETPWPHQRRPDQRHPERTGNPAAPGVTERRGGDRHDISDGPAIARTPNWLGVLHCSIFRVQLRVC